MKHKLCDRFLILEACLLKNWVGAKTYFQEHLEKQDDSSKWKNIPEDELMSYVEEIEDDIIFYPEEAPGEFSLGHQITNQSIVSF